MSKYLNLLRIVFLTLLCIQMVSCRNNVKVDPIENINKGALTILCDEDFRYIMNQHKDVYENLFPGAVINFEFLSDGEIIKKLMNRSAQAAVIGRRLSAEERANLQNIDTIIPREHLIAKDAMALIVGKSNTNFDNKPWGTFFSDIFRDPSSQLVFTDKQSGLVKSFSFINKDLATGKIFALDSLTAVIDYVNSNNNAIGAISYATISDMESPEVQAILKKVKLLRINISDSSATSIAVTASEQDIATNQYPLIRTINYVLLNPKERVGMGFVNYLMRNRGAKVFLKSGLIPAVMPERDFILNTEGIEVKKD